MRSLGHQLDHFAVEIKVADFSRGQFDLASAIGALADEREEPFSLLSRRFAHFPVLF
jgi:hypothetical protein